MDETIEQFYYYFRQLIRNPEVKAAFSILMVIINQLFGTFNQPVRILLIILVADLLLGIAKGIKYRNLCSRKAIQGVRKLLEYLATIFIAYQLELLAVEGLRDLAIFWICYTELTSIIENLDDLDIIIPPFLRKVIKRENDKITDNS